MESQEFTPVIDSAKKLEEYDALAKAEFDAEEKIGYTATDIRRRAIELRQEDSNK